METRKLKEILKIIEAIAPLSVSGTWLSGYHDAMGYRRILGIGQIKALTSGNTFTVQLMQATSAAGAGAKVLGTAGTFTVPGFPTFFQSGGAAAEVFEAQLDTANGFRYVAVRISHDHATRSFDCSALLVLGEPLVAPVAWEEGQPIEGGVTTTSTATP